APAATATAAETANARHAMRSPAGSAYSAGTSMASPTMTSKLPTWRASRRGCIVNLFSWAEQFLHLGQRGGHAEQNESVSGADFRVTLRDDDLVVPHQGADDGAVQAPQLRQRFPRGGRALLHHQLHRLGAAVFQKRHGYNRTLAHQFQHGAGGDEPRHHHGVSAG